MLSMTQTDGSSWGSLVTHGRYAVVRGSWMYSYYHNSKSTHMLNVQVLLT